MFLYLAGTNCRVYSAHLFVVSNLGGLHLTVLKLLADLEENRGVLQPDTNAIRRERKCESFAVGVAKKRLCIGSS